MSAVSYRHRFNTPSKETKSAIRLDKSVRAILRHSERPFMHVQPGQREGRDTLPSLYSGARTQPF